MSDDIIKKALGMSITVALPEDQNVILQDQAIDADDEVEIDFDYVRENLNELIAQGKDAINELMSIAKQSQHPRAFEVIATLLKATADLNSDLLATHKKKADLRPQQATHTKGVASVTNNNLFVGSTADLQNFLEQQKKLNG